MQTSYHDLHITTAGIPRTSIFNLPYSARVTCTRVGGWELWDTTSGELIASEYGEKWLKLDVAGHVIVDSSPKSKPGDEILALAATAAGYVWRANPYTSYFEIEGLSLPDGGDGWVLWDPRKSSDDALRLAVDLGIDLHFSGRDGHMATFAGTFSYEDYGNDPHAATRFAITTAAAQQGRSMAAMDEVVRLSQELGLYKS